MSPVVYDAPAGEQRAGAVATDGSDFLSLWTDVSLPRAECDTNAELLSAPADCKRNDAVNSNDRKGERDGPKDSDEYLQ